MPTDPPDATLTSSAAEAAVINWVASTRRMLLAAVAPLLATRTWPVVVRPARVMLPLSLLVVGPVLTLRVIF